MSSIQGKILIINDHRPTYARPLEHLNLPVSRDHSLLQREPKSVALVVFTGGADVNPRLYDQSDHRSTHTNLARDMEETNLYNIANGNDIPMVGICRGAQFLCVMAGGVLVQDVTNHTSRHAIAASWPGKGQANTFEVTSSHHQMQYPAGMLKRDFEILAWTPSPRSDHYAFNHEITVPARKACNELKVEPEVVWYPGIKALAVQYHPEWMRESTEGFHYFQHLVDYYLVPLMEKNATNRERKEITQTAG